MTTQEDGHPDAAWRTETLAVLAGGTIDQSTEALLALTFNDADGGWVEGILLGCLNGDVDDQVKMLALVCFGHLARIHGEIRDPAVFECVHRMARQPAFAGQARGALADFETYL